MGTTPSERMGRELIARWTARWHDDGACPCYWGEQHTGGHCCFAANRLTTERWCHEREVDQIIAELPRPALATSYTHRSTDMQGIAPNTVTDPAITLARLTRKLRRWESNLVANERHYMADGGYSDVTLARVRAELDIVRDALEEIGETPANV